MATEESAEEAETRSRVAGLIVFVLLSPIFFIFDHFGQSQKGFLVTCVTGVFAATIYVKGRKLLKPHSISVMIILFIAQILGLLLVDVPGPYFRPPYSRAVLPFAVADLALLFAVLGIVDRAFGLRTRGASGPGSKVRFPP